MNRKDLTATEYTINKDSFGKTVITHSYEVIAHNECKKYAVPLIHFIKVIGRYIQSDELQQVTYCDDGFDAMIKDYNNVCFMK
jgi:aspartate/glutamate racemase